MFFDYSFTGFFLRWMMKRLQGYVQRVGIAIPISLITRSAKLPVILWEAAKAVIAEPIQPFARIVNTTIIKYKIIDTVGFASALKVIFLLRINAIRYPIVVEIR